MKSFITITLLSCISAMSYAQLQGILEDNQRGGLDVGGRYNHQFNDNLSGSVFGKGTLYPGNKIRLQDKTYGGSVDYSRNGNSLNIQHVEAPHSRTDSFRGTLNLYDNGRSRVNTNVWGSHTRPRRQSRRTEHGGNIEWVHNRGHSFSVGVNEVRQPPLPRQQTIDATGNVNILKDKNWSLDAYGQASKNIGDFNRGRTDWGTGLTLKGRF